MTRRSNVRRAGSPIVHAHARSDYAMTRCGFGYSGALYTEDPVDCMTCLVYSEWANSDIREIIIETSVKDIQEFVDARYLDAIEWENKKRKP